MTRVYNEIQIYSSLLGAFGSPSWRGAPSSGTADPCWGCTWPHSHLGSDASQPSCHQSRRRWTLWSRTSSRCESAQGINVSSSRFNMRGTLRANVWARDTRPVTVCSLHTPEPVGSIKWRGWPLIHLLTPGELELGSAQSLHHMLLVLGLGAHGHDHLTDVYTCHGALRLPKSTAHPSLEPEVQKCQVSSVTDGGRIKRGLVTGGWIHRWLTCQLQRRTTSCWCEWHGRGADACGCGSHLCHRSSPYTCWRRYERLPELQRESTRYNWHRSRYGNSTHVRTIYLILWHFKFNLFREFDWTSVGFLEMFHQSDRKYTVTLNLH